MPELPEVETTRRGIEPHLEGKCFSQVTIRQPRLRWPVPDELPLLLPGLRLTSIGRRGKYLLLTTDAGTLLLHLGMSGSLRVIDGAQTAGKHDHVDFVFDDGSILRFNDPRKFGAVLWTEQPAERHPLLAELGPEPLTPAFDAVYLLSKAAKRRIPVKSLIMDSRVVVGVGNIYASESLFEAGILPTRTAESIDLEDCERLVAAIRNVLSRAIAQGGTTLRDFSNAEGKPGYFQQQLAVYGRAGESCRLCLGPIRQLKIAQRASYYCDSCQR